MIWSFEPKHTLTSASVLPCNTNRVLFSCLQQVVWWCYAKATWNGNTWGAPINPCSDFSPAVDTTSFPVWTTNVTNTTEVLG